MGDVGPNFDAGATTVGRKRLPAGVVAILDDAPKLIRAIRELFVYSASGSPAGKRTLVFRLVTAAERQAILYRVQNLLGIENFTKNALDFHIPEGHWHAVDSEHVMHIRNRHGNPDAERARGRCAITMEDFERIPDLVDPRNICQFSLFNQVRRIKYRREYDDRTVVLIQEIRAQVGVVVKTLYREK